MNDYSAVISAINFVNSAFLLTIGFIIIIAGLLIVNNLVMRFYISMGIVKFIKNTILDVGNVPQKSESNLKKQDLDINK
jgi:hypothetical protein